LLIARQYIRALRSFTHVIVATAVCLTSGVSARADEWQTTQPIKVGVSTALTGDAAAFGLDIRNALTLMNERNPERKYELIFEDERCDNRTAVNVAKSLIHIHKVRYVLGFPCVSTLLATARSYSSAGVLVIASSSTGDVQDVGPGVFRLFPADAAGAQKLYTYMSARHKRIAILTEENEYPVMMERTVQLANKEAGSSVELVSEQFIHGDTDLKSTLLRLINKKVDALFINANTEDSFISAVKQIRALQFKGALYAVYLPASSVAQKALGKSLNGFIFSNLPLVDNLVSQRGREVLREFRRRFGEPKSGFPVAAISFEAYRIFDQAIHSGKDPIELLKSGTFNDGLLPSYHFDKYGAVQGINFEMQAIEDEKVVVLDAALSGQTIRKDGHTP
jgi:ABC-type branched-subunit amino acid transport system substrate-binding protein